MLINFQNFDQNVECSGIFHLSAICHLSGTLSMDPSIINIFLALDVSRLNSS